MTLELVELHSKRQVRLKELRKQTGDFPGRSVDQRFLVREKGTEVALLWLVVFPPERYLVIYRLYVAERFRGNGIGSELIRHAETLTKQLGRSQILLTPEPLSPDTTREELVAWYKRRGFAQLNQGLAYFKDVPTDNSPA
jgi:GNAT superfamily N-acetyltransferase